jgi:GR25 family glycosyltransferase involved in LPS biosynthesis
MIKSYIIHNPRSKERTLNVQYVQRDLAKRGIDVKVVTGPSIYNDPRYGAINIAATKDMERPMTPAEIACAHTHILAMREFLDSGDVNSDEKALFLEDDIHFCWKWPDEYNLDNGDYINIQTWDVNLMDPNDVYFECKDFFYSKDVPYGSAAVWANRKAVKAIVDFNTPIITPCDVVPKLLARQNPNIEFCYAKKPCGGQNDLISSTIR